MSRAPRPRYENVLQASCHIHGGIGQPGVVLFLFTAWTAHPAANRDRAIHRREWEKDFSFVGRRQSTAIFEAPKRRRRRRIDDDYPSSGKCLPDRECEVGSRLLNRVSPLLPIRGTLLAWEGNFRSMVVTRRNQARALEGRRGPGHRT